MDWILHNWHTKLLAVAIAAVLWAATQGFRTDETNRDVPIHLINVPEDVVVTEQSNAVVNVSVAGSRAALRSAKLDRFPISLSGVTVGQAFISVDPERVELPRGARISEFSPTTVQFRVEPRLQKSVPIKAEVVGALPDGYRLASVEVTPAEVAVTGPRNTVTKIHRLETDRIDLSQVRGSSEQSVRVVVHGNHVELVNGSDTVRVRLEVEAPEPDPSEAAPTPDSAELSGPQTEGT